MTLGAIDVNSISWVARFLTTGSYPESRIKEFPLLQSAVECASLCFIKNQCGGFMFDTKCNLYFRLSIEDVQSEKEIGPLIRVMPMRLEQASGQYFVNYHHYIAIIFGT